MVNADVAPAQVSRIPLRPAWSSAPLVAFSWTAIKRSLGIERATTANTLARMERDGPLTPGS